MTTRHSKSYAETFPEMTAERALFLQLNAASIVQEMAAYIARQKLAINKLERQNRGLRKELQRANRERTQDHRDRAGADAGAGSRA